MKNNKLRIVGLLFLFLLCTSCREDSTMIYNPEDPYYKQMKFQTLAGQWEYLWQAMDNSYVFWDMEQTNWNDLYDEYLQKFERLDAQFDSAYKECQENRMPYPDFVDFTSKGMQNILKGDLEPRLISLQDQHFKMVFYNKYDETLYKIRPSLLRLKQRSDYHLGTTNDEIKQVDTSYKGIDYVYDYIQNNYHVTPIYAYNEEDSAYQWAYACEIIEGVFYLRMGGYFLSNPEEEFNLHGAIICFFNGIIKGVSTGNLKGIILDNRGNRGGYAEDFTIFPGYFASSPIKIIEQKTKNGLGRYDYSAYVDYTIKPSDEHIEIGNTPFIILQDMHSASMGELVGYACSLALPSAVIIGERSVGATGMLIPDYPDIFHTGAVNYKNSEKEPNIYTSTYSSNFYNKNTQQWECVEGIGIEPDIYCPLDYEKLKAGIEDTQLERAIEFINSKK